MATGKSQRATADVVVVGGGIVGLATAMQLIQRHGALSVTVVEAESRVAGHQSGHNSGVLHSGIYYKPGSNKAKTCRAGKAAMEAFCDDSGIMWDRCGKVVVATSELELAGLNRIAENATANGVEFERIDTDQLRQLEPAAAGIAALHVPATGIVNYVDVCAAMHRWIVDHGGKVVLGFRVAKIHPTKRSIRVSSSLGSEMDCGRLINCAGLQSDRVLQLAGGQPSVRIVPFRGEYYELNQGRESLCRNLIYPVPDPAFPFLGVHFTRMIGGGVECGPNAVLALSRHGYDWKTMNPKDLAGTLLYPGFLRMAKTHWRMGVGEIHRSLRKTAFVRALQRLIPSVNAADLKPGRAGVRAQAVAPEGGLLDDFLIEPTEHAIHVLNAPSPAATASIAIADQIVDHFEAM
ncbi:L-2-hydroxyglutarate oxidase LhgO [Novipirellula artificiosorum]|uniref:L-2-hydroxyglutarate oxidase LhgO n=2 Tax=Novipirellula artificiosorum TaxID=2528016 RepID=A0A5C6D716_9BACT|nr:L-2-hydroxyglutarate oxidase LhgO [Novipirellula artificiosorum]